MYNYTDADKKEIIETFRIHPDDTGSYEVIIALLTFEIAKVSSHLETHKKDKHSRRGLLNKVSKRRKLLVVFKDKELERYKILINKLGLRK
jgi:small subunit ribosomal protein S15